MKPRRNDKKDGKKRGRTDDASELEDGVFAGLGSASAEFATGSNDAGSHTRRSKKRRDEQASLQDEHDYQRRLHKTITTQKLSTKLLTKDTSADSWKLSKKTDLNVQPATGDGSNQDGDGADTGLENQQPDGEAADAAPVKRIPLRQQLVEAKENMAKTASLLNQNPETNIGGLRDLQEYTESEIVTIKKLALVTLLSVYKDIIPGYRIRPLSETDMEGKVSKEIRQLRDFEQRLVTGYKKYLDTLSSLSKPSTSAADQSIAASLSTVAVTCACELLVSVPHFNFRSDLIKILVRKVSVLRRTAELDRSVLAFEQLFREDEDGYASTEAVGMVTKMIKARDLMVHESVLNMFLHLRLLHEFSFKASASKVDRPSGRKEAEAPDGKQKQLGRKVKRQQREFRTKRERKQFKELKEIQDEMAEADATVSHEDRDRMQGESLKLVFGVYFRVLKARLGHLTGAVLEGLARYAHLINQDFFTDIIEALRELVSDREAEANSVDEGADETDETVDNEDSVVTAAGRDNSREALLCAITAFALLNGQQSVAKASTALGLDLGFFVRHLYRSLMPLSLDADIDLAYRRIDKSIDALSDQSSSTDQAGSGAGRRVNFQTTIVLLIRCLSASLLPTHQAIRSVPPVRLAAFCKRLLTLSVQLPEKSAVAVLGLVTQVVRVHGERIGALWFTEERRADGIYDPLRPDLEASNPFAATAWEGELLRHHYCPTVRGAAKEIDKAVMSRR